MLPSLVQVPVIPVVQVPVKCQSFKCQSYAPGLIQTQEGCHGLGRLPFCSKWAAMLANSHGRPNHALSSKVVKLAPLYWGPNGGLPACMRVFWLASSTQLKCPGAMSLLLSPKLHQQL
eukprot:1151275-Pelagomonas_calceolata.AAC.7